MRDSKNNGMEVDIVQVLQRHRAAILQRWRETIMAEYAPDTARFLASHRDPFTNPVAAVIERALEGIIDWLIGTTGDEAMQDLLEELMRVRAVQGFSPSRAVGFVFALRSAIEETLSENGEPAVHVSGIQSRIDELALRAFECYVDCREKISNIKMREVRAEKERVERVIKAMNRHAARTHE